jgi:hypothetical protein
MGRSLRLNGNVDDLGDQDFDDAARSLDQVRALSTRGSPRSASTRPA